jgi:hypothetical protein
MTSVDHDNSTVLRALLFDQELYVVAALVVGRPHFLQTANARAWYNTVTYMPVWVRGLPRHPVSWFHNAE